jgi:hypothetical protein
LHATRGLDRRERSFLRKGLKGKLWVKAVMEGLLGGKRVILRGDAEDVEGGHRQQ